MPRFLRLMPLLLAITLGVAAAQAAAPAAPGSSPTMQTMAPTGLVIVKFTAAATDADRDRVAGVARATATPRVSPALLATAADKARRPSAALNDLARYVQFDRDDLDRAHLVRLVQHLAADPAVDTAFLEPRAVPAALGFDAFTGAAPTATTSVDAPLPTPDFTEWQGYMADAPQGVGAWTMWSQPGARGGTVKIVDVEGAWLWDHEDLPAPFLDLGQHIDDLGWRNHGTAVMGEMRGIENEYGVDGIVPDCQVGNSSIGSQSFPDALLNAAMHMDQGDLLLIELHAPGPNATGDGQYGYVPMEFWQDNFDAIRALTDLGMIVVEAAGNGQQDLDDQVYLDLFDRQFRDSGAIMVGATAGSSTTPAWFTNHGERVDLSGWGLNVATCAYGDLQGGDETEWYTVQFSGTSSASPIVTGSAASLQGMIEAAHGFSADANLLREVLRQTGTETDGPQLIGPRPDLVAGWALAAQGVGMLTGTVTESGTGTPLAGVTVKVQPDGPMVTTDTTGGYRLGLLPDTYQVTFTSYFHEVRTDVVAVAGGANVHDAALIVLPLEVIAGTVSDSGFAPLTGARLELVDEPVPAVLSDAVGAFTFDPVPEGLDHRLLAGGVPGYGGAYQEFPITSPATAYVQVFLPEVLYDFESGAQGFIAESPWERGRPAEAGMGPGGAFDGQWCWGVGIDGSGYGDEVYGQLTSPTIAANAYDGDRLYLSFHYWCGTEPGFDGVHVLLDPGAADEVVVPVDGYTDLTLGGLGHQAGWSGSTDGWRTAVFDVTSRMETAWSFAVAFGSDQSVNAEGFLLDGVTLEAVDIWSAAPDQGLPDAAAPVLSAWPNPFNPRVNLAWELAAAGRIDLEIYDLRGRLVRSLLRSASVSERGHVTWDGVDVSGHAAPSGVYLVRVRDAGSAATTGRITLAR